MQTFYGTVKWYQDSKSYGFLTKDDGEDVFVHQSQINGTGFITLVTGQKVQFNVESGEKGLFATNIIILSE